MNVHVLRTVHLPRSTYVQYCTAQDSRRTSTLPGLGPELTRVHMSSAYERDCEEGLVTTSPPTDLREPCRMCSSGKALYREGESNLWFKITSDMGGTAGSQMKDKSHTHEVRRYVVKGVAFTQ